VERDYDARPLHSKGDYVRDEDEQARYLKELVDVFDTEGVDSAFLYTFARYDMAVPYDIVSAGVVKKGAANAPGAESCVQDARGVQWRLVGSAGRLDVARGGTANATCAAPFAAGEEFPPGATPLPDRGGLLTRHSRASMACSS